MSTDPAPSRRSGLSVAAFFALCAPFANAGGLALAPLQAIAGIAGAPWTRLMDALQKTWPIVVLILAFGGWAAMSALWSPVSSTQGARLVGALVCGLLFTAAANENGPTRRLVRAAALAGVFLLVAHGLIEALFDMPLNRLGQPDAETGMLLRNPGRGTTFLVVLFLAGFGGWITGAVGMRIAALLSLPAVAWLSLQFDMDANAVAFALGAVAFALGFALPRIGLIVLTLGIAGWLLAAPWALPSLLSILESRVALPDSWAVRVEIWRFVTARIAEQPLLGHGLDSARAYHDETMLIRGVEQHLVPLHPHNASLQIWLETGAVGASLGAIALIAGGWMAANALRGRRAIAGSACAAIAALALYWNVSFGIWQEWLIAAAFAAAALVGASRRRFQGA